MLQNPDRMDRRKDRLTVCVPWHAFLCDCGTGRQSLQIQKRASLTLTGTLELTT